MCSHYGDQSSESKTRVKPDYIDDLLELAEQRHARPKRQVVRDRSAKDINASFPWALVGFAVAVIAGLAILATLLSGLQ